MHTVRLPSSPGLGSMPVSRACWAAPSWRQVRAAPKVSVCPGGEGVSLFRGGLRLRGEGPRAGSEPQGRPAGGGEAFGAGVLVDWPWVRDVGTQQRW